MTGNDTQKSSITTAIGFLTSHWLRVLTISLLLLIPCFWHSRIEAGDLGSHVYNAWLAQLIQRAQAPGLYIAKQRNNILFDLMLLKLGNLFGLAAAEKIAVCACALSFFWGAFALLSAVSKQAPWSLLPCLAMLAYGWTFNVGFFNYYLSVGLGFFDIAIAWRIVFGDEAEANRPVAAPDAQPSTPQTAQPELQKPTTSRIPAADVVAGSLLAALVFLAHPQGFAWLIACLAYILLWKLLPGWWKLILFLAALGFIFGVRLYCSSWYKGWTTAVIWYSFGPGIYNGSDQIALNGSAYTKLAAVALLLGVVCFVADINRRRPPAESWKLVRLPLELYCILVFGTYVLPDVLRVPFYPGWIGSLALRLTTISAAMGLSVIAIAAARKWHAIGFGAVAAVFFSFLYRDTGVLNRMEREIEALVSTLPPGQRVLATIWAAPDSRVPYIVHMVDRACIARCFSYEDYEPASGQFRVRVQEDSPIVTADTDDSEDMQSGDYAVKPEELPIWQIYQCDPQNLAKLCIRPLSAGEKNGRLGYHPPAEQ